MASPATPASDSARAGARPGRGNGRTDRAPYDLEQVLLIAANLFNERGYEATSMGALAERLGTSKSAIYYYVRSKEELLALALERAVGELEHVLDQPGAQHGRAIDRLRFVLAGAVEVLVADLPYVTLLLRLRGNSQVELKALERRRRLDHVLAELVATARDEGSLRAGLEPALTARLLLGTVNSLVEWYRPGGPLDATGLAAIVVEHALRGICPG